MLGVAEDCSWVSQRVRSPLLLLLLIVLLGRGVFVASTGLGSEGGWGGGGRWMIISACVL